MMAAEYRANYIYMHDDVVSLLAHSFGEVYFLPKKLMFWRRHASAVTGERPDFLSKLKHFLNKRLYVLSRKHYKEKEAFYNAYKDDLNDEARRLFSAYLAFPENSLLKRIILIIRHGFSFGGSKLRLIFKTIICRPME